MVIFPAKERLREDPVDTDHRKL